MNVLPPIILGILIRATFAMDGDTEKDNNTDDNGITSIGNEESGDREVQQLLTSIANDVKKNSEKQKMTQLIAMEKDDIGQGGLDWPS